MDYISDIIGIIKIKMTDSEPDIDVTISLLEKLNKYLQKAIIDSVAYNMKILKGTNFCNSYDINSPACAKVFSKKSIEYYLDFAKINGLPDLVFMCVMYLYFEVIIKKYYNNAKTYIQLNYLQYLKLRLYIKKVIQLLIKSGIDINNDKQLLDFIQLNGVSNLVTNKKDKILLNERLNSIHSPQIDPKDQILLNERHSQKIDPFFVELKNKLDVRNQKALKKELELLENLSYEEEVPVTVVPSGSGFGRKTKTRPKNKTKSKTKSKTKPKNKTRSKTRPKTKLKSKRSRTPKITYY